MVSGSQFSAAIVPFSPAPQRRVGSRYLLYYLLYLVIVFHFKKLSALKLSNKYVHLCICKHKLFYFGIFDASDLWDIWWYNGVQDNPKCMRINSHIIVTHLKMIYWKVERNCFSEGSLQMSHWCLMTWFHSLLIEQFLVHQAIFSDVCSRLLMSPDKSCS